MHVKYGFSRHFKYAAEIQQPSEPRAMEDVQQICTFTIITVLETRQFVELKLSTLQRSLQFVRMRTVAQQNK